MLVLGIEAPCDEPGVAVYDSDRGLLAHGLHSQVALHDAYGGVVPELASRDHIRRLLPLIREVLRRAAAKEPDLDAVAYTQGPGLAGALLVGAAVANSLAFGLGVRAIGVHHLEGHLLSPLLEKKAQSFPFVALLVAGCHTQLMRVPGGGGRWPCGEILGCDARNGTGSFRRGGRRRRQHSAALPAQCGRVARQIQRFLPGDGILHRQRRDGRASRMPTTENREGYSGASARIHCEAALEPGRRSGLNRWRG